MGKAAVFNILHVWKYQFFVVIDALRNYFCPDIIIWFDIFRVNQHADVDLDLSDWWSHSFKSLRPPRRATSR